VNGINVFRSSMKQLENVEMILLNVAFVFYLADVLIYIYFNSRITEGSREKSLSHSGSFPDIRRNSEFNNHTFYQSSGCFHQPESRQICFMQMCIRISPAKVQNKLQTRSKLPSVSAGRMSASAVGLVQTLRWRALFISIPESQYLQSDSNGTEKTKQKWA